MKLKNIFKRIMGTVVSKPNDCEIVEADQNDKFIMEEELKDRLASIELIAGDDEEIQSDLYNSEEENEDKEVCLVDEKDSWHIVLSRPAKKEESKSVCMSNLKMDVHFFFFFFLLISYIYIYKYSRTRSLGSL